MSDNRDRDRADQVYAALLERAGERWVQPRKERTAALLELLDDPQRTYRVVHVTGTNGKTSTARLIESLVRAQGLRTGLFTSPHLERFTERIMIDGEPISDAAVVAAWEEIVPLAEIVDAHLTASGEEPLTFFELLTVLAFVACADAPIDVLILEVGMGGSWDSTNTADADVAVFTPIDLDHTDRLGTTAAEIAGVKAGIIKQNTLVVSAQQLPEVEAVLREHANLLQVPVEIAGQKFSILDQKLAVGGQLISVQGLAGTYLEHYLPLYGAHQGSNAALAIAAVESLLGAGDRALAADVVAEAFGQVTSPGRLQLLGIAPTVLVDAAHNPHGAKALALALRESFDFDEWAVVLGVLGDKDAAGIVAELAPVAARFFVTAPDSERSRDVQVLADLVENAGLSTSIADSLAQAAEEARQWAGSDSRRAVIITGSVVLAGEAIALAELQRWKGGE